MPRCWSSTNPETMTASLRIPVRFAGEDGVEFSEEFTVEARAEVDVYRKPASREEPSEFSVSVTRPLYFRPDAQALIETLEAPEHRVLSDADEIVGKVADGLRAFAETQCSEDHLSDD